MTGELGGAWDGMLGTAGGPDFGRALEALARERGIGDDRLAHACGLQIEELEGIYHGTARTGISGLARLAHALRSNPIEFLQRTGILSLEVYAGGLDPLYFLPPGPVRYEARIYMREINPRHQVPEADMTKRNPVLSALAADPVLDALGKVEVELAYLLRGAVQWSSGGPRDTEG
jgi:hypothetical protein